jgi:3-phenylpropionate/cinnamic acid dioxygenase small subunit
MTITLEDRIAIQELLGLYGHLIDQRRWAELADVFSDDIVFDATSFGQQVTTSYRELMDHWTSDQAMHPLAHHVTNIVITEDPDGTVRVLSKALGVGVKGRVGSATYEDIVVKTADGWRLSRRVATLRRPDSSQD